MELWSINDNGSLNVYNYIIPTHVFISQVFYLLSSRSVVVSQPAEVRVRQDLGVSSPPQIIFFSMLW